MARFSHGHTTWAAYAREGQQILQEGARQIEADTEIVHQRVAQEAEARRENALAAIAILGAMRPNPGLSCTSYGLNGSIQTNCH
jgi:hypothetical protein